jgi:hypothetical protein
MRVACGDGRNEAIAVSMYGLDNLLCHAAVIHRLARLHDAVGERGVGHELPRPELLA